MNKRINWTQDKINFIIEKYTNKEMNTYQLGEYFNCSNDTICRKLKENGIIPHKFYEDLTGKTIGELYVLGKSKKSGRKIFWDCQCSCGKIITVVGDNLRQNRTISCGCIKSKGERKIAEILTKNNIIFSTQFTFSDLKSEYHNLKYKFDFAIYDNNNNLKYLIEYDGEQHFEKNINLGWITREIFLKIRNRDEVKNQYCIQNKIPLIRIPYTHFSKLKLSDLLLETSNFRKV